MGAWSVRRAAAARRCSARSARCATSAGRSWPARPRAGPTPTPPSSAASSSDDPRAAEVASAMPVEVRVPPLGESVVEATVGAWLKHEGDAVEAGEPLVELETEKVNVDVAAERSGVLDARSQRDAGETVHPGDVLAMVARGRRGVAGATARRRRGDRPASAVPRDRAASDVPRAGRGGRTAPAPRHRPSGRTPRRSRGAWPTSTASTSARSPGSGTGGRVTREDVEQLLAAQRPAAQPAAALGAAPAPRRPARSRAAAPRPRRARPIRAARSGRGCRAAARRSPSGCSRRSARRPC